MLLCSFTKLVRKPRDCSILLVGDDLERGMVFGTLRRFGSGALRRPFIGVPPALERLFIAFLVGSGCSLVGVSN